MLSIAKKEETDSYSRISLISDEDDYILKRFCYLMEQKERDLDILSLFLVGEDFESIAELFGTEAKDICERILYIEWNFELFSSTFSLPVHEVLSILHHIEIFKSNTSMSDNEMMDLFKAPLSVVNALRCQIEEPETI